MFVLNINICRTRYLVTFFEIIEEKIRVCHREDQVFHVSTQMVQVISVFNIPESLNSFFRDTSGKYIIWKNIRQKQFVWTCLQYGAPWARC